MVSVARSGNEYCFPRGRLSFDSSWDTYHSVLFSVFYFKKKFSLLVILSIYCNLFTPKGSPFDE